MGRAGSSLYSCMKKKGPDVKHVGRCVVALPIAVASVSLLLGAGASGQTDPWPEAADPQMQAEKASRLAEMAAFGERAVVKPSRDSLMGFSLSTSVFEVVVTAGRQVREGDLLVRGDDSEDIAEAKFQRARADTQLPVDRARAQADLAEIEYQRQVDSFDRGASSPLEVDRARLARDTAKIDLDLALLNQVLSDLQASRAEARVEKLSLRAPFDGIVDIVHVDKGQSIREGEPVVRVVAVDPLWIDVHAPNSIILSQEIVPDCRAWVLLQEDVEERVYEARVIQVAPTADAGSGTRRVRVEMENAIGLVPGVNCWVRFTEPPARWQDSIVDPGRATEASLPGDDLRNALAAGQAERHSEDLR